MQPYFFPALSQFRLMAQVDRWVVFDTAQYHRRGWMNRNRVLHPDHGWRYIRVPVHKVKRETPIFDIVIRADEAWRDQLLKQLEPYRGEAPRFQETLALVQDCLDQDTTSLARLNVAILAKLCSVLDVPFEPVFCSETGKDPGPGATAQDRIITIAQALGATVYCNPVGGSHLYDAAVFAKRNMALEFIAFESPTYATGRFGFAPGLSIIDALMWCAPDILRKAL